MRSFISGGPDGDYQSPTFLSVSTCFQMSSKSFRCQFVRVEKCLAATGKVIQCMRTNHSDLTFRIGTTSNLSIQRFGGHYDFIRRRTVVILTNTGSAEGLPLSITRFDGMMSFWS